MVASEVMRRVLIDDTSGCWNWTTTPFQNSGYGRIKVVGRVMVAHRFAWEVLRGPIPQGMQLDHLCRNRRCVNPEHLEVVTPRTNVLRGETIVAANYAKTHCHHGHPLNGANLFVRRDGRRRCRTCEKANQKKVRATPRYRAGAAARERRRRAAIREGTAKCNTAREM